MKLVIRLLLLIAVVSLVEALPAGAQQRPAPQPVKKDKKIWTNEDLADIRKPWDDYVDQKIAAAAAAEAARAKEAADKAAAKSEGQSGEKAAAGATAAPGAPDAAKAAEPELTIAQLEDMTNARSAEVQEAENAIGSLSEELASAVEGASRDEVNQRMAEKRAELEKKRAELKELEARLEKARAKNPGFQRGYVPND